MSLANNPNVLSGSAPSAAAVGAAIQTLGINNVVAAVGAGTNYTVTTTSAAVTFGTTSPTVTLPATGIYFIALTIQFDCTAATFTTQSVVFKIRRTNNTPADLANTTVTFGLPTATTITRTVCIVDRSTVYSGTAGDTITVFANLSAALGAGTLTAVSTGTYISAWRLN